MQFSLATGREELRILACPQRLPWISPKHLFDLKHGDQLRKQDHGRLGRVRSLTNGRNDVAWLPVKDVTIYKSLDAAARERISSGRRRGIGLVLDNSAAGNLVCYTSGAAGNVPVLIGRMILEHKPR